ncbi:MAG: 2OG-Fe(II) oxygenase [Fibrella sp.]|nr:2OG-Fe(II) oxygenase [Armatimonadota bacterium]
MQKESIDDERVFVIRDFLTPDECVGYVATTEAAGYTDAPLTTSRGFVLRKDIRDNTRVMVDDVALAATLFGRAHLFLPTRVGEWSLLGLNERFRYYRYENGQTFRPHFDGSFDRSRTETSFLTFMVYLNDGFIGGDTAFYRNDGTLRVRVVPKRGMALIFEHQQLHEGAPVESGRKYVLRTDVMYQLNG